MEQVLNAHMMERHFDAAFSFRPRAQGHILQTRHAANALKHANYVRFVVSNNGHVTRAVGARAL